MKGKKIEKIISKKHTILRENKNAVKSKLPKYLTRSLNTVIFVTGLRNDMPTIPNTLKSQIESNKITQITIERVKAIIPIAYLQPKNRISTVLNNPLLLLNKN